MTVEIATNFTISHTIDQAIVEDIETTFDGYRSRIAMLSVEACGTLTSMYTPLGPIETQAIEAHVIATHAVETHVVETHALEAEVIEAQVIDARIIDIEAIEWDQFAVELVAPTLQSVTA